MSRAKLQKIIKIPILPWNMVNSYLIVGSSGCVLIDAGLPESESKVGKVLKRNALTFKDIKLIVVTHAHVDHAGNAARLRELSGALIAGHEGDAEYYERKKPMTYCPTSWSGRLLLKTPLPHVPYEAFIPDIMLSAGDEFDLDRYGVPGLVKPTPGHTAGSVSVILSTQEALVGDLIASGVFWGGLFRTGHARRPPFEDDPRAVGAELNRLVDCGINRFYMGHGGPLRAKEVKRHALSLMVK